MTDKFKYTNEQIESFLSGIFDGSITERDLPEDLYFAIAEYLKKGLYEGFGGTLSDFGGKDLELLTELRENVYMFSAAKTFQEVKQIGFLMFDENGDRRSQKEFNQLGEQTFETWNEVWGRTEYNTAIGQAQMASKWQEIERDKDLLPTLVFDATGEECEICRPFEGLAAPVDDPVWRWATPLLHFNCQCVVRQEDKDFPLSSKSDYEEKTGLKDTVPEVFQNNPGKDCYVFSPEHPYFQVEKKDINFAKENFGLPIPKDD